MLQAYEFLHVKKKTFVNAFIDTLSEKQFSNAPSPPPHTHTVFFKINDMICAVHMNLPYGCQHAAMVQCYIKSIVKNATLIFVNYYLLKVI